MSGCTKVPSASIASDPRLLRHEYYSAATVQTVARVPPLGFLRQSIDFAICMAIALAVMALAALGVTGIAAVILGGLLVLAVPGYSLSCVLWGSESDLSIADRVAFTVGLSVSLSMFDVLALSIFGVGIFPLTLTIVLGYETLVFSVLGLVLRIGRHQGLPGEIMAIFGRMRSVLQSDRAFWGAIGVCLLAAVVLIALTISVPAPTPSTQFYVFGPDGTASSLPTRLTVNQSASVLVGVYNGAPQATTYTVTVCLVPVNSLCPGPSTTLANWTSVLSLVPNGTSYQLNVILVAGGRAETPLLFAVAVASPPPYILSLTLGGGGIQRDVRLPLNVSAG